LIIVLPGQDRHQSIAAVLDVPPNLTGRDAQREQVLHYPGAIAGSGECIYCPFVRPGILRAPQGQRFRKTIANVCAEIESLCLGHVAYPFVVDPKMMPPNDNNSTPQNEIYLQNQ
jgi:hypothetical protein